MGGKGMDDKKTLLKKISMLQDQIESYKAREAQMEQMIMEYNEFIKKQFEVYDDFIKDIGTSRLIDPVTRVYSDEHIMKLVTYYHQKAFEEGTSYAILMVRLQSPHEEQSLVNVAKFLKRVVRIPMDSVGRYSDDTFLVLLTDIKEDDMPKVVQRIENGAKDLGSLRVAARYYPSEDFNLENIISSMEEELLNG